MRTPRIKPDGEATWHHVFNHALGLPTDRPFHDPERAAFLRIKVLRLFNIEVAGWCILGNHFHCLLPVPAEPLSRSAGGTRSILASGSSRAAGLVRSGGSVRGT